MSTNLTARRGTQGSKTDVLGRLFYRAVRSRESYDTEFLRIVSKARQEISDAENYFDNVTEPELVDHAIYKIEAAKSQYTYLIKQAKTMGIKINI